MSKLNNRMLKLQTTVDIPVPHFDINYKDKIALFGSCFSDNIGNILLKNKFNTVVNPFGVLYNPASIAQGINVLFTKSKFDKTDLNFYNEKWFSFLHHSTFSSTNESECLQNINNSFLKAKQFINNVDIVIITLGTAWAYLKASSNNIVSNCHKLPAKDFTREFLGQKRIVQILSETIKQILKQSPNSKFIFTVSPIRHWKDGAIENTRSKSSLLLAIKDLQDSFPETYYFPAYEIFMDELRDYRFYASDMLHPSEFGIEYVWGRFKNTFFNKETNNLFDTVEKIIKSYNHKTFDTTTRAYQNFKNKLLNKTEILEATYPFLDFSLEKLQLK